MSHPFLANDFHIRWSTLSPEAIEPDITKAIKEAQAAVETVASLCEQERKELTYENTLHALDEGLETLHRAWDYVSHLNSVCNSPEFRDAYNQMLPAVSEFFAAIPLNEKLWEVLKAYAGSDAIASLAPIQQRYLHETMEDFRDAGADLPSDQKKRVSDIQKRLAEQTQKYFENCLDATNAWEKIVTHKNTLAGLPESALAAARQSAEEKGKEGWLLTLQDPSYIAVMTYAENDALREEVWKAYASIGRNHPYDNRKLVPEILELRHELARLVGQAHFADHVIRRRMVASGTAALRFGKDIFNNVQKKFLEEMVALRSFKSQATGKESSLLEPWESAYWAEKQQAAHYDFDEEALRPYFPINRVIKGMYDIAEKLFGLQIKERNDVEIWHKEVKFYDLFDAETEELLGAFYTDWHPRKSKQGGAWANPIRTGNRDSRAGARTPHLGLICGNLTPPIGDQPALLTHREVETIFHEFGHLLHHLCGEVEVKALNGTHVAWDFVELPSQIMENWCSNRESLDLFARHHETGAPIPEALFEKMQVTRNYMKASFYARQLALGKMDLELHIHWPESNQKEIDDFVEETLEGYIPEYKTRPQSQVFNFNHLFSSPTGYAASYYSYKWAEVLEADAFTRFQQEGVLNSRTGRDFRNKILARGNSEDPARLFEDFMGRPPDSTALLRRDGLIAPTPKKDIS